MTMTMEAPAANALARANGNNGAPAPASALAAMAQRYAVSQEGLIDVIKKTCITGECSDAHFKAFVLVANQYQLNPMTREIHAFADTRRGIVPIVGIDGWSALVNRRPDYDGCEFTFIESADDLGCTCTMHVKNRSYPVAVTEWLSECKRNTPPWNTMKRRMLRHRSFIQCARLAFSLSGLYDEDEGRDVITNYKQEEKPQARLNAVVKVTQRPVSENQTFEPDPAAVAEAESEQSDAGSDLDEQAPHVEPESPPAANYAANYAANWQATQMRLNELAMERAIPPSKLDKKINDYLLRKGCKGEPDKLSEDQRRELLALVEGE